MSSPWGEHEELRRAHCAPIDIPSIGHAACSAPTTPYPGMVYEYLSISHPGSTPSVPPGGWGSIHYSPDMVHSPDGAPKYPKFALPLVTDGLSSSVDSVSDVDYLSPLSQSYSREEMPFGGSPAAIYDGFAANQSSPGPQSPSPGFVLDHSRAPTSCPGFVYTPSEPRSSLTSCLDRFDAHFGSRFMRECEGLNVTPVDAYDTAGHTWTSASGREDEQLQPSQCEHELARWPALRGPEPLRASLDFVAGMSFMDYYRNTMAPSMVYVDGPHNPFRHHILQLAANSQSLQHAICALSACNLRMKRKLSLGHDTRELWEKLMADKLAVDGLGGRAARRPVAGRGV